MLADQAGRYLDRDQVEARVKRLLQLVEDNTGNRSVDRLEAQQIAKEITG